mmetsp:Transcript_3161/g.7165  ORF Transcript_3161/g.7165 Transcript_3161/m.7165 type:complete len:114 (+) Transcript_3161:3-344(+)
MLSTPSVFGGSPDRQQKKSGGKSLGSVHASIPEENEDDEGGDNETSVPPGDDEQRAVGHFHRSDSLPQSCAVARAHLEFHNHLIQKVASSLMLNQERRRIERTKTIMGGRPST